MARGILSEVKALIRHPPARYYLQIDGEEEREREEERMEEMQLIDLCKVNLVERGILVLI